MAFQTTELKLLSLVTETQVVEPDVSSLLIAVLAIEHNSTLLASPSFPRKSKAVPLRAMVALGGKGGIAPTHS
jgi:hypothetical protein